MSKEDQVALVGANACEKAKELDWKDCMEAAKDAVKKEMNTWIDIGGPTPHTHTLKEAKKEDDEEKKEDKELREIVGKTRSAVADMNGWRSKGPIIMVDGKVVSNYGMDDTKFKDVIKDYKQHALHMGKIIRGLFTGQMANDSEYIQFCEEAIKNLIDSDVDSFMKEALRKITKEIEAEKLKPIHSCTPTAPDRPVRLMPTANFWTRGLEKVAETIGARIPEVAEEIDITDDINSAASRNRNRPKFVTTLEAQVNEMMRGENIHKTGRGSAGPDIVVNKRTSKKKTTKKKVAKKKTTKKGNK